MLRSETNNPDQQGQKEALITRDIVQVSEDTLTPHVLPHAQ